MTIEERIQELRKSKGLSQEQLADILGVSRQAVSKWEGGQSLPEIEKLIAMSEIFEVSVDYILKGGPAAKQNDNRQSLQLKSQVMSAIAMMLFVIGIISSIWEAAQISDEVNTMGVYSGLIFDTTGVMLILIGWFMAGGRIINKELFTVNILLAVVCPSSFISQMILGGNPAIFPPLEPWPISLFAVIYAAICGVSIYFTILHKKR